MNGLAFRRAVGTEPSSSLGYSVYVGLNYGSSGGWNQYDSAKLSEVMAETEPFDAEAVQERMLDAAAQRFSELSPAQLVKLAVKKLILLWAEDDACLSYSQGRLSQTGLAAGLCNAFYFLLWLLSGLAALRQFRAGPRGASPLLTLCFLFVLGLTAAHLLTECAIRYHYSGSALLCITAAHCLDGKRLHTV